MLKLDLIFNYAKCTTKTLNFCEGGELLNAKHVVVCGLLEGEGIVVGVHNIYALVLQTSAINE